MPSSECQESHIGIFKFKKWEATRIVGSWCYYAEKYQPASFSWLMSENIILICISDHTLTLNLNKGMDLPDDLFIYESWNICWSILIFLSLLIFSLYFYNILWPSYWIHGAIFLKSLLFFSQFYWGNNWHITLHKFKIYNMLIWYTYIFWNNYHHSVS